MSYHYRLQVSSATPSSIQLHVAGEVDMAAAPLVMDAILGAALSEPSCEVRVDLTHVSFIDSMGLSALIEAHRRLDDQGVRLCFSGASPNVQKLAEITGTAGLLGIDESEPTAPLSA